MRRWTGVVLLALLAVHVPAAECQTAPPVYPIELAGALQRYTPVELSIPAELGPNLLRNPSFAAGAQGWRLTAETDGSTIVVDDQAVVVRAAATRAGTIHASQTVAKPDGGPFLLSYQAASIGQDAMGAAILLRERNGTQNVDTVFNQALTPTMQTYRHLWTPKVAGGEVQVFLRVRALAGQSQAARIDEAVLQAAPEVSWAVEGARVSTALATRATAVFMEEGHHALAATAHRGGQVVWTASADVTIANLAPVARLASVPAAPSAGVPGVLDASGSFDPDAPFQLRDESFSEIGRKWRVATDEVGGPAVVGPAPGSSQAAGVTLAVGPALRNGTAYLVQTVELAKAMPAVFSVSVRDDGDIVRYAFLFRERNATGAQADAVVDAPPTGGTERRLSMQWTPQLADATSLEVFLRARINAGAAAEVTFSAPRLQAGLSFRFELDGARLVSGNGTAAFLLQDLNPHRAAVEAVDADGAAASAGLALQGHLPYLDWRLRGPAVAPLGPPLPRDAHQTVPLEGPANLVANGDFAAGISRWTLSTETLGPATVTAMEDGRGPFARIAVEAARDGTTFLVQPVDRLCLQVACVVGFEVRVVTGAPLVEPILRAQVQGPDGRRDVDLRWRWAQPEPGVWVYNETSWTPPADNVLALNLYLRFATEVGTVATVDFRDVRVGPVRTLAWTVDGPSGPQRLEGPVVRPAFDKAGRHLVQVQASTRLGASAPYNASVDVLPVTVYPTMAGLGLSFVRDGAGAGSIALLAGDGNATWAVDLGDRSAALPSPSLRLSGREHIALTIPPGFRLRLANSTGASADFVAEDFLEALPAALEPVEVDVDHRGLGTVLTLRWTTNDPTLVAGHVRFLEGGREIADAPLERVGDELVAHVRLPSAFADRDLAAEGEVTDAFGRSHPLSFEGVEAKRNPVLVPAIFALALAVVAIVAGTLYRYMDGRRR